MVSGWRGQTAVILYRKRSPRSATLVATKSPDSKPLETFLTIKNYEEVDYVRAQMDKKLKAGLAKRGFFSAQCVVAAAAVVRRAPGRRA